MYGLKLGRVAAERLLFRELGDLDGISFSEFFCEGCLGQIQIKGRMLDHVYRLRTWIKSTQNEYSRAENPF